MAFCQNCGSPVEGRFCAKCGAPTGLDPGAASSSSTIPPAGTAAPEFAPNLASALCYIPILGGVAFLLVEPYNRNKLIRFHAFQSLYLVAALFVIDIVLSSLFGVIGIFWAFFPIIRLAFFGVLIFVAMKAYKGQKIVLPVIGPLAEKQA
jgi:uncharacterized membrane protein